MIIISKERLTKNINKVFQGVRLEDGIGLWEGQGLDDRLMVEECKKLRKKDEKDDWNKISVIDLYKCSSSLSFFDAKGMRFHMPIFLLFALDIFEKEDNELHKKELLRGYLAPDVEFYLLSVSGLKYLRSKNEMEKRMEKYDNEQFSLFNVAQINCLVEFLIFRMKEIEEYYSNVYAKEFGTNPSAVKEDKKYIQIEKGIEYWKKKITMQNIGLNV